MNANLPNIEIEDASGNLLELAANNDLESFKQHINREPSLVDEVGPWYGRHRGSSQMVLHHLTPLTVAATYGSLDVLKLIVSSPNVDVNRSCGIDESTPLHCAASGGSQNAVDVIKLLLSAGADPSLMDVNGRRPVDVVFVSPKSPGVKHTLRTLLADDNSESSGGGGVPAPSAPEKKEYPADPSLPDIKNVVYSTDEFRMFSFKVRPCSRAYSHDWTECPFVHPGENARRRDPRKYHYSCVPCPDFRKGACRRGDTCEYAHGVFESWLHPAQYRTRPCKDGTSCSRRVCFFAHTQDELRPLYVSTGSAVPSPRSNASTLDFTPPMSPSGNGISSNTCWASQQNVPALHLPGSGNNIQSSRLRSSLNARDIDVHRRYLEDIFSAEGSSPRFSDFSPTHKSAIHNQFQQGMLSPIRTSSFSPGNIDHSLMPGPFGVLSPGRMSPRHADPVSPMSARVSMLARQDNNPHERFRSLSSRDLGCNALLDGTNWSEWGPPSGPAEWAVTGDELAKLKRSSSFEGLKYEEEPDLSWVHSLVKESPQDLMEKSVPRLAGDGACCNEGPNSNQMIEDQSVLGAWLEQMQLDQLAAM